MRIPKPEDYDPKAIKATVSLAGVVTALWPDSALREEMNGDFTGLCQFHSDTNPSFSVYVSRDTDGTQKWKCWSCLLGGDVFDFVQAVQGCDFATAKSSVLSLRDGGELPDPPPSRGGKADPIDLGKLIEKAKGGKHGCLPELLVDRKVSTPIAWLRKEWEIADDPAFVYVPHYDPAGQIVGLKTRWHIDWTPTAKPGSDLSNLYGCWRKGSVKNDVVICEGESDTWFVSYVLREAKTDVFGLPHGVCAPTQDWLQYLADRNVTLLFDSDTAGRSAIREWLEYYSSFKSLRVAVLPDGADANSAGADTVLEALASAQVWKGMPTSIGVLDGVYAYTNQAGVSSELTDFTFEVQRLVRMSEHPMFEVKVPGNAETQFLHGDDLTSNTKFKTWCTRRLLVWLGTDRQVVSMLELLKALAFTVPQSRGVDVIGLHGNVFVLPDKSIGASGWSYVAPENDVKLSEYLCIEQGPFDLSIIDLLPQLHDPTVMTPIVGWIAAAPFRSLFNQFPILSVTGGSGWGKTTILEELMSAFGYLVKPKTPVTLTGSTPHAISSYASCSNAIPIWFDEYRPGARLEARQRLEQIIRDAFDGSSSVTGGMYESRMKIKAIPACAPIIVSGEDAFSETSHVERMVMVDMPSEGKNLNALKQLRKLNRGGLGYAYLQWGLENLQSGSLPLRPDNPDRAEHSLAVAEWGYRVLGDFAEEVCGYHLSTPFDGSASRRVQESVKKLPPFLEALMLTRSLDDKFNQRICHIDPDGDGYVKPQSVVKWVRDNTDLKLPGGSKAMQKYFESKYDAKTIRHPTLGNVLRIRGLEKILEDSDAD